MALDIQLTGRETIDVVSRLDSSVKCSDENYENYLKTLDENLLELDGEPTRFVLKKVHDYKTAQAIRNGQIGVNMDGKSMSYNMGYMLEDVRMSLIDIKNPGSDKLAYKKDGDGGASKELMALLEATGIVNDLFTARSNAGHKQVSKKS